MLTVTIYTSYYHYEQITYSQAAALLQSSSSRIPAHRGCQSRGAVVESCSSAGGPCFFSGCCTGVAYFPLSSFLTFSDEFHVFVCACICLLYVLCECLELSFVQRVRRFLPRCAFFCYLMFPSESLVSVCLTPCDRAVRYIPICPVSSIRVPMPFALITVLLLCSAMCFVPRS